MRSQTRYPGALWIPTHGRSGHPWTESPEIPGPPLLVFHTRETVGMGTAYPWPPHLTVDPAGRHPIHQHITFDRSAYALRGGPDNHRRYTYQVELAGYARDTPHWPDAYYERLAVLVSWFHANLGVPMSAPWPFTGPDGYGLHGAVRVTPAEWNAHGGIVGHAHAPHSTHWDPGAFDVDRMLTLAGKPSRRHLPGVDQPKPKPHHDLTAYPHGATNVNIPLPVLRHTHPNTRGQHVKNLQALLHAHGHPAGTDGVFGPAVETATKAFQHENGIHPDGIVGPDTWRHLL